MSTRVDGTLKQVIGQCNRHEQRINIRGRVTLVANATTTVVRDPRFGSDTSVSLTPMSASAAAEQAAGMYILAYGVGSFSIAHRNLTQVDRTFSYMVAV